MCGLTCITQMTPNLPILQIDLSTVMGGHRLISYAHQDTHTHEKMSETAQLLSCIQQRKATCLLLIPKLLSCTRASKLITTNSHGWTQTD